MASDHPLTEHSRTLQAAWTLTCLRCDAFLIQERAFTAICPRCGARHDDVDLSALGRAASRMIEEQQTSRTLMFAGFGAVVVAALLLGAGSPWLCFGPFLIGGGLLWPMNAYRFAAQNGFARGWFGTLIAYHITALFFFCMIGIAITVGMLFFISDDRRIPSFWPWENINWTHKLIALVAGIAVVGVVVTPLNPYWWALRRHWRMARRSQVDGWISG